MLYFDCYRYDTNFYYFMEQFEFFVTITLSELNYTQRKNELSILFDLREFAGDPNWLSEIL